MKKTFLFILPFLFILAINCSSDETNNDNNNTNNCSNVDNFTVSQSADEINFNITSSHAGAFEIKVVPYEYSEQIFSVTEKIFKRKLSEIGIYSYPNGIVCNFYIRKVCSPTEQSEWGHLKTITVSNNFCRRPKNITFSSYSNKIEWEIDNSSSSSGNIPAYYQIQYGPQGFSLGSTSSTTVQSNTNFVILPFIAGQTYDVYVRSYCNPNSGFGNWVGPLSCLASITSTCSPPTNVSHSNSSVNSNYYNCSLQFNTDNSSQYQVFVSPTGETPSGNNPYDTNGYGITTINNLYKYGGPYYVYIRKKCPNNTYSSYFGPYVVNWN